MHAQQYMNVVKEIEVGPLLLPLDGLPSILEIGETITSMSNSTAVGPDKPPAELSNAIVDENCDWRSQRAGTDLRHRGRYMANRGRASGAKRVQCAIPSPRLLLYFYFVLRCIFELYRIVVFVTALNSRNLQISKLVLALGLPRLSWHQLIAQPA